MIIVILIVYIILIVIIVVINIILVHFIILGTASFSITCTLSVSVLEPELNQQTPFKKD